MEDTLRGITLQTSLITYVCLNPCFNGRYSQSKQYLLRLVAAIPSLNPCFNGRYSQSDAGEFHEDDVKS